MQDVREFAISWRFPAINPIMAPVVKSGEQILNTGVSAGFNQPQALLKARAPAANCLRVQFFGRLRDEQ